MKAIILAAGEGVRLRPLTLNTPKCLLTIGRKTLLEHWLDNCIRAGVTEVLINGHYLFEKMRCFVDTRTKGYHVKINLVFEEKLLGTGGTINMQKGFVQGDDCFFFCHGDNFTDMEISDFLLFHKSKGMPELSVALFKTNRPKECGIAEKISEDDRIIEFEEKPPNPRSNLASAAMFFASPKIFDVFPEKEIIDFSKEILPMFKRRMFGYKMKGFNIDIGTPENYLMAQNIAENNHVF